jgi:hypothetical protein
VGRSASPLVTRQRHLSARLRLRRCSRPDT